MGQDSDLDKAEAEASVAHQEADAGESSNGDDDGDGDAGPGEESMSDVPARNRPRRKATEKPSGPDALRQSFSKRKKGIAAKAYQLSRLTDAKVALFVVNDKGSSWAYATPGFGAAVSPAYLALMRKLAGLPSTPKLATEVISHPNTHPSDDREHWQGQVHPALAPLTHAASAAPVYKLPHNPNLGANMVAMLHHGFPAAGQAVGHPTGHLGLVSQAHSTVEEAAAAAAAAAVQVAATAGTSQMYATAFGQAMSAGQPTSITPLPIVQNAQPLVQSAGGFKRSGAPLVNEGKQAKAASGLSSPGAMQRPQMASLTRQAAILPTEAPPPEGLFGKHNAQPQFVMPPQGNPPQKA